MDTARTATALLVDDDPALGELTRNAWKTRVIAWC